MIVVTGCAGFIGFHLTKNLLEKNKKVIGIDIIDKYYDPKKKKDRLKILNKYKNFKFFKIDLNKYDLIYSKLKNYKVELIIHLAAQPGVRISIKKPHNTLKQNLVPFINILEIARLKKVKKFLFASSSSIYGDTKIYPFVEKDNQNVPVSVYGATKLSNEIIASSYSKNFNMKTIALRFFTVYGPYGRPDMAYYSFLDDLKKNKKIRVFNKGHMMRDFTYVDDVIKGIISLINFKMKKNHDVINIGKGKPDQLMELIKLIEVNYKKKFKIEYTKNIPNGDIKKTFSNVSKAKKLIKWKPKVNLDEGIKRFVNWYKLNND
jgi:UDP-glucuronate 4-epimerase